MEELSEAFGLNQRASALDPETVSETDVSHGKHQTDPIQGMSSKAAESGQGSSELRNLGEKKNEKSITGNGEKTQERRRKVEWKKGKRKKKNGKVK